MAGPRHPIYRAALPRGLAPLLPGRGPAVAIPRVPVPSPPSAPTGAFVSGRASRCRRPLNFISRVIIRNRECIVSSRARRVAWNAQIHAHRRRACNRTSSTSQRIARTRAARNEISRAMMHKRFANSSFAYYISNAHMIIRIALNEMRDAYKRKTGHDPLRSVKSVSHAPFASPNSGRQRPVRCRPLCQGAHRMKAPRVNAFDTPSKLPRLLRTLFTIANPNGREGARRCPETSVSVVCDSPLTTTEGVTMAARKKAAKKKVGKKKAGKKGGRRKGGRRKKAARK